MEIKDDKIILNFNDNVRVKLNDRGYQIWHQDYNKYVSYDFRRPLDSFKKEADSEGFVIFQLWEFMNIFGSHLSNGFDPPCETNIEFYK